MPLMEEEYSGEVGRGETYVAGVLVAPEGPEQPGEVHEGTLQALVLGAARGKGIDDVKRLSRGGSEDRPGLSRRHGGWRGSWNRSPSGCGGTRRSAHRSRSRSGRRSGRRSGGRGRRRGWSRGRRGRGGRFRSVLGSSWSRRLGAVARRGGGRALLRRLVLSGSGGDQLRGEGLRGGSGPGGIGRGHP